jgi:DNA-directed RNA polymerase subunit RPC12/RpoP
MIKEYNGEYHILRCSDCEKKMGLSIDEGSSSHYCFDCSHKQVRNPDTEIGDWKFGLGGFGTTFEYLWDERYL